LCFTIASKFAGAARASRFLKIPIPSRLAAFLKSTDSGGAFSPLRASCFLLQNENRAAENTACYLPFANTFCPLADRILKEPP
ncbi:hypothetical protein, partial [Phocaeicola dorei]|uniref:hypothetical protein n=1 Tax=Phocaeicola dorei TaxID=357276 RepID=UPI003219700E